MASATLGHGWSSTCTCGRIPRTDIAPRCTVMTPCFLLEAQGPPPYSCRSVPPSTPCSASLCGVLSISLAGGIFLVVNTEGNGRRDFTQAERGLLRMGFHRWVRRPQEPQPRIPGARVDTLPEDNHITSAWVPPLRACWAVFELKW